MSLRRSQLLAHDHVVDPESEQGRRVVGRLGFDRYHSGHGCFSSASVSRTPLRLFSNQKVVHRLYTDSPRVFHTRRAHRRSEQAAPIRPDAVIIVKAGLVTSIAPARIDARRIGGRALELVAV